MPPLLTRDQARRVDEVALAQLGFSSLVLMENAGRGCADVLAALGAAGPVAIVCGCGNNAGDGFVLARHLALRGIPARTTLLYPPEELAADARANFEILRRLGLAWQTLGRPLDEAALAAAVAGAEWIVDALLGTGARGAPRAPLDRAIAALNSQPGRKLALDVPSGLDCDTGAASPATFRADHTCTFVAAKPGLIAPEAQPFVGELHVVHIGLPLAAVAEAVAAK